jgi:hypothetical protein
MRLPLLRSYEIKYDILRNTSAHIATFHQNTTQNTSMELFLESKEKKSTQYLLLQPHITNNSSTCCLSDSNHIKGKTNFLKKNVDWTGIAHPVINNSKSLIILTNYIFILLLHCIQKILSIKYFYLIKNNILSYFGFTFNKDCSFFITMQTKLMTTPLPFTLSSVFDYH